jgi:hypothetical protein
MTGFRELAARRAYARYQEEQQRRYAEMNRVRSWPDYSAPELGKAVAHLRTVCASESPGVLGRFRYQLRIDPASEVLNIIEPPPKSSEAAGDESDLGVTGPQFQREWDEFTRRRDTETLRLQRRFGIPGPPVLTLEFLDQNGFKVHEVLIPSDSLVRRRLGSNDALVAERQQNVPCGPEVLQFHSWRLRPLPTLH